MMTNKEGSFWKALIEIFAGGGLGLLTGVLIGLSVSQVVGVVIGSLTALLVTFFGLSDKGNKASGAETEQVSVSENSVSTSIDIVQPTDTPESKPINPVESSTYYGLRVGCFALACILGLFSGLYARTHNLLGIPVKQQKATWEGLGFSPEQVRQLIAFQELGITPSTWIVANAETTRGKSSLTAFYADEAGACDRTRVEIYATAADAIDAWKKEEGNWKNIAELIEKNVQIEHQKEVLEASRKLTCK